MSRPLDGAAFLLLSSVPFVERGRAITALATSRLPPDGFTLGSSADWTRSTGATESSQRSRSIEPPGVSRLG